MKYYILNATIAESHFKDPTFKTILKEHFEYLQSGFDSGKILVSGPKVGGGGGIIVMKGKDINDIHEFCDNDPPVKAGIKEYQITEFKMHDSQEIVKNWFEF